MALLWRLCSHPVADGYHSPFYCSSACLAAYAHGRRSSIKWHTVGGGGCRSDGGVICVMRATPVRCPTCNDGGLHHCCHPRPPVVRTLSYLLTAGDAGACGGGGPAGGGPGSGGGCWWWWWCSWSAAVTIAVAVGCCWLSADEVGCVAMAVDGRQPVVSCCSAARLLHHPHPPNPQHAGWPRSWPSWAWWWAWCSSLTPR